MLQFQIISLAIVAVASAQQYQQTGAQQPIAILRQSQDSSPEGSYNYQYETENGIAVAEEGKPGPVNEDGQASVVAQGSFQYNSPDGTPINVQYVANENGFQPQGAHLPVAPEIPPQIQRALEWIAAHPAAPEPGQRQVQQPQVYNRRP